jgi:hypothetical protein
MNQDEITKDQARKRIDCLYSFLKTNQWKFVFKSEFCYIFSFDGIKEITMDCKTITTVSDFLFVELLFEIKKTLNESDFVPTCPQIKVKTNIPIIG